MNNIQTLTTPCAKVHIDPQGICHVHFFPRLENVEEARQHNNLMAETFKSHLPFYAIADLRDLKHTTKEVRNFFGSEEVKATTAVSAIIIGSGLSRIVGNLFLKFSKPLFPTKLFSNEEKAKQWLLEQKAKNT